MIAQLKSVGHVLSDEQQVQAVIRSLPNNWEHLKCLGAAKAASNAFVAESSGLQAQEKLERNGKD
ncbi:hypothetical protein KY290_000872 [Solanum tuberosum]|uniref:Uncharacterized protein n=1 Tax=Solanum tuberosum TaxID=4113 RepID=A0ABQ7WMJ9_SOLTU|nr:hypothetical protein KY289_000932 [Solanum tuberosum]KAH0781274.1 hypothetical protein KY290_000872 [Solanum tuberosum]